MAFEVAPLPYAYEALEPYIDAQTMRLHHDKPHQAYVDNLNKAVDADPNLWREQLDISAAAHEAGSRLHPQIAARPFGMLLGFPGHHAFTHRPTYRRLKAECSREELAARLGAR